ncbi:MAG TPA: cytochrome c oxidase subunit II [Baekduia sp.]|nr:cytochrome c oxidase subunit II [Baekduia sp.]
MLAAISGVLLAAPVAGADLLTPEDGGSPNADSIDELYKYTLAVALIVFFGVEGVLLYSLRKFRARKGAVAAQIRGNTRLEIGWTVGAALVLVVLATVTFLKLDEIRNPPKSGENGLALTEVVRASDNEQRLPPDGKSLNIEVNGLQYVWRYTYPDRDENVLNNVFAYEELVVPVDTTVTLEIRGQDVIHSWWIPALGGKKDATPGYTNHTWFKIPASKAGQIFRGQCAELCGRNHANMVASVRAVTPQEFERYLAQRRNDIRAANLAAERQRREQEQGRQPGEQQTPRGESPGGDSGNPVPGAPAGSAQ